MTEFVEQLRKLKAESCINNSKELAHYLINLFKCNAIHAAKMGESSTTIRMNDSFRYSTGSGEFDYKVIRGTPIAWDVVTEILCQEFGRGTIKLTKIDSPPFTSTSITFSWS